MQCHFAVLINRVVDVDLFVVFVKELCSLDIIMIAIIHSDSLDLPVGIKVDHFWHGLHLTFFIGEERRDDSTGQGALDE